MKYLIRTVAVFILYNLIGCAPVINDTHTLNKKKNENIEISKVVTRSENHSRNEISHLTQCNRDLESLHTVSESEYRRYQSEYDRLMKSSADFLTVKDDVSPEVAELARPKFQFALVNLCYRIKDSLAQILINQAGGR